MKSETAANLAPHPLGPPGQAQPARSRTRRGGVGGRLARAYALLIAVALLIVGIPLIAISRNAQREQIVARQQKTASEAMLITSAYLSEARNALSINAQGKALLLFGIESQQRELKTMLTASGEIFESLTLLDEQSNEVAKVSRFYTFLPQELGNPIQTPEAVALVDQALAGQMAVGGTALLSEYSGLPVMIMVAPHSEGGRTGALLGEVSLKGMWDAVAQVEVGRTGYAYIVDGRSGQLLGHSELSLYLERAGKKVTEVPIVRQIVDGEPLPTQYQGLEGQSVIGAAASLPDTDWHLVVELPTREAMASVTNQVWLLAGLLAVGLLAAGILGTIVPRRIVRPLHTLQEGAEQIGQGRLTQRIQINTGDEIEDLAEAFNDMATSLAGSRTEIERWGHELEAKVDERTRELAAASSEMERRNIQLQTSAEVARTIAEVRDLDRLLPEIAHIVSERFGWYHTGIFLLDAPLATAEPSPGADRFAVLRAANSEGGQRMLARGHRLKVGEVGIVGYVAGTGQPRIALDVGQDAVFFDNPDLPTTHSEMALPLKVGEVPSHDGQPGDRRESRSDSGAGDRRESRSDSGAGDRRESRSDSGAGSKSPGGGQRIIGVLDVQSEEPAAYDEEDIALLTILADQVAIAIENARLFAETRQALREVETVHRQYLRQEWSRVTSKRGQLVYEYRDELTPPLTDFALPEMAAAMSRGDLVVSMGEPGDRRESRSDSGAGDRRESRSDSGAGDGGRAALATPIMLRDQPIGVVHLEETSGSRYWSEDEIALVKSISDQVALALENVRLLEAEHEQRMVTEALREAAVTLSATLAFDDLVQRIMDQASRVVPGDASTLMLVEGDQVRIVASRGYEQFGAQEGMRGLTLVFGDLVAMGEMQATGRPVLIANTDTYPGWKTPPGLEWVRSYVGAPIIIRGVVAGILNIDSSLPGFFTQENADQLAAFASQAAIALQNAQLMAETTRRAEQMAGLNRIGLALSSGLEVDPVLETLYEQCRETFEADTFYVALYDRDTGFIHFPMLRGLGSETPPPPRPLADQPGLTGYIIETGQPLLLADSAHLPEGLAGRYSALPSTSAALVPELHLALPQTPDAKEPSPLGRGREAQSEAARAGRSFIGVPMLFREQVIGVISVQSSRPNVYTPADMELLTTISSAASIAIENARAYQRLVDTAEQLREVDRLKTQFLANMSHELRTPLNSIIGFSRVMLKGIDGPLTDVQTADLSSIYNSGQHLLRLINDILDMSKIEAGRMDLSFDEIDLHDIFEAAMASTRALVKDRPIELLAEVPDDLPSAWADSQRVRQILINLLSNASKFTEAGRIVLSAVAGPEFVTISVTDTGIGIDAEAQKKLFIPFQQVDASTTRRAGGTGLGLAICRSFVEMQGGRIWVESEVGKGSTFRFTLPLTQATRQKVEDEQLPGPAPSSAVQLSEPAVQPLEPTRKKPILVIDDDVGVITMLKRYLEREDYQVVGVTQSQRALDMAQKMAPELAAITLDVVMPQLDGWQILKALKDNPATRDVPVILCSIVEGLERGLNMGAAAYLNKPVTRDELLTVLKKAQREV